MSRRRESRQWALQMLFQLDMNPQDADNAVTDFISDKDPSDADVSDYAGQVVLGVSANKEAIDETLAKYARNWDIRRMSRTDRNVLRIAIYELLFREDIPALVSINEAVDIACSTEPFDGHPAYRVLLDSIMEGA